MTVLIVSIYNAVVNKSDNERLRKRMAAKFEFYLSEEDFDRLYEIKRKQGKNNMSGNEFAKELLKKEIYRQHPGRARNE